MVLFDYVTQTWWFQYHVSSGWFVDRISEETALAKLKQGWDLVRDDIGAVNAAVVESFIRSKI